MNVLKQIKARFIRLFLRLFYGGWYIMWNVKSSMKASFHITSDYKGFIIECCHLLGFQDTGVYIEEGPTDSYIVDVYMERVGLTKIVPKPKSLEHMMRRGMRGLFRDS